MDARCANASVVAHRDRAGDGIWPETACFDMASSLHAEELDAAALHTRLKNLANSPRGITEDHGVIRAQ